MPIGGFVVHVDPKELDTALGEIRDFPYVEVHGADDEGNVVVVIDTPLADQMEDVTSDIQKIEGVLSVGLTYFHAEDEIEKYESGELKPEISFGRKRKKQKDSA